MAKKRLISLSLANLWRKSRFVILAISFILTISISTDFATHADEPQAPLDAVSSHLHERIPTLMERYDIPGASIALIQAGEMAWSQAYGYADREQGRPMTTDTLYRVQSITKSVTAWGVMKLVERGEIELDNPVGTHITRWELPDADFSWDEVTVRRLLSHSAGLPVGSFENVAPDEESPSLQEALSEAVNGLPAQPTKEPSSFRYSNLGYALLELLIEDVTGRDFAEYMDEEILDPLRMDDATLIWSDRLQSELATEHLVNGNPVPVYRQAARAHGSLYATVEDIAQFVAAGTEGTEAEEPGRGVLAPDSVAELHTPVVETTGFYALGSDGAGLGHFVETLPSGQQAVAHGGQGAGSWSWYHAVPETGDGIVVLTNSERSLQLIADVVGVWADWMGFSHVKLSRAGQWVRVPIWIVGLVAVGLAVWLGYGGIMGKLSFDPLCDRDRMARAVLGGLAAVVLGLWWSIGREFVSHFLPVIADWFGSAMSVLAGLVLLTALFPRTGGEQEECE